MEETTTTVTPNNVNDHIGNFEEEFAGNCSTMYTFITNEAINICAYHILFSTFELTSVANLFSISKVYSKASRR